MVIGSGPNGLAAGITLCRAGLRVLLVEGKDTIGGGMRSQELTLPGFTHDVCSAVHPMAVLAPFFRTVPLAKFGLEWAHPEVLVAHPLADGHAVAMYQDAARTAETLPRADQHAYQKLYARLQRDVPVLLPDLLGPLLKFPRHPFRMAGFGLAGMQSAVGFARRKFSSMEAQALFAGHAAHSILPLEQAFTAAVGLMISTAGHLVGWPVVRGGSQRLADALGHYFSALGGEIVVGYPVERLEDLPAAQAYLFDTGPRALAQICGRRLPDGYQKRLHQFRYGLGTYKLDLALSGPIPWRNAACRAAGTVHLGGTLGAIAASEAACWQGRVAEQPFVLLAQQSVADDSRAPAGQHTCWAYCHTPPGFTGDLTDVILTQIEHAAPGFRELILKTHVLRPTDFTNYNPNYVGGDILGGAQDLWQMIARPVLRANPYATPVREIFLCSASTPPGGGVHGMCGFHAATTALRSVFGFTNDTLSPS